jgi:glycosyltransferase involved in cell wall biosynthesis
MDLNIVCTAYERPTLLMTQLCSLAAQTLINFKILVFHDGHNESVETVVKEFKNLYPHIEIEYTFSTKRFNDYGHSLREIALNETTEKFTLLTNDDNYYAPNFIQELMPALLSGNYEISYCNMIHSHDNPNALSAGGYQPFSTQMRINWIDIGSFIFDTKIGQKVGFSDKSFAADGVFLEKMIAAGARPSKNDKYLFVHN